MLDSSPLTYLPNMSLILLLIGAGLLILSFFKEEMFYKILFLLYCIVILFDMVFINSFGLLDIVVMLMFIGLSIWRIQKQL